MKIIQELHDSFTLHEAAELMEKNLGFTSVDFETREEEEEIWHWVPEGMTLGEFRRMAERGMGRISAERLGPGGVLETV